MYEPLQLTQAYRCVLWLVPAKTVLLTVETSPTLLRRGSKLVPARRLCQKTTRSRRLLPHPRRRRTRRSREHGWSELGRVDRIREGVPGAEVRTVHAWQCLYPGAFALGSALTSTRFGTACPSHDELSWESKGHDGVLSTPQSAQNKRSGPKLTHLSASSLHLTHPRPIVVSTYSHLNRPCYTILQSAHQTHHDKPDAPEATEFERLDHLVRREDSHRPPAQLGLEPPPSFLLVALRPLDR